MAEALAATAVYRSLLRLGRHLDRNPVELVTLLGHPHRHFDFAQRKVVHVKGRTCPFTEGVIWQMSGRSSQYAHPLPEPRIASAIRQHRRVFAALQLDYLPSATELLARLGEAQTAAVAASTVQDGAEKPLSTARRRTRSVPTLAGAGGCFGSVPSLTIPEKGAALDRYDPDCQSLVRVGDLLIAHPLSCVHDAIKSETSLDQAVILIDDVVLPSQSIAKVGYVRGVVVNKVCESTLGSLLWSWPQRAEDEERVVCQRLEALLGVQSRLGGDLRTESLWHSITLLHTLGEALTGSREVAPGLYVGGSFSDASSMLRLGVASHSNFRVCMGFAGWRTEQLRVELEQGVWIRARIKEAAAAKTFCLAKESSFEALAVPGEATSTAWWRSALGAVGLPALAEFPRGELADRDLKALLRTHQAKLAEEIRETTAAGTVCDDAHPREEP
mmetsp:Transcript_26641/g.48829  ORF Transcript_26641/g.48829 Transcript_26641/m.48829 type:complete len:444 (+) Transcript_26641:99-1430(+)